MPAVATCRANVVSDSRPAPRGVAARRCVVPVAVLHLNEFDGEGIELHREELCVDPGEPEYSYGDDSSAGMRAA